MKKAMTSRTKKRTKDRSRQGPDVNAEAMKTLRTVGDQEAFYFYEALDKPTGEVARSLPDFLEKVSSVKQESLMFHLERRDFQNWVEKILGDSKLAEKLERISTSNSDDIRTRICEAIQNRISQLAESSAGLLVDKNSAVLLPSY